MAVVHDFPRTPGASSERNTGTPRPSGPSIPRQGASFPPLGSEVRFQRSPDHHPETGIVWGRQFGTRVIEIVDSDAKPLRLMPDQYEVIEDANAC